MNGNPSPPGILHVDMDAFYASVEVLERPELAGRPVIVGGSGARGVVASCSYEARAYGVHSAMPSARARRLCAAAVFLPGRFGLYQDYSRRLHTVLASFTPLVEGVGLDEAFLDVTGARRLFGDGQQIAAAIRGRVRDELGLGCSVGVAASKLVAKLASRAAKPRATPSGARAGAGVIVVAPGEELAFMHPLPVEALWGVGQATLARLRRLGVLTVGDLAALPPATVVGALGPAWGRQLSELARGHDQRRVEADRPPKSVGHEETYARDHHGRDTLGVEVVRLSDAVASRLRGQGLAGRTVTLKVRFGDFRTITRCRTLPEPVATGPELAGAALELLAGVDPAPGVRLLGVAASNLVGAAGRQLSLNEAGEWERVSRAVDGVRRRFGEGAVAPAALLLTPAGKAGGLRVKRQGDQQWGPSSG